MLTKNVIDLPDLQTENAPDAPIQYTVIIPHPTFLDCRVTVENLGQEEVHWPAVAFGLGLKPYDPEVEPFVPPEGDDTPALPFSSVYIGHQSSGPSTEHGTPPSTPPLRAMFDESASALTSLNETPIAGSLLGMSGFGDLSPRMMSVSSMDLTMPDVEAARRLHCHVHYTTHGITPTNGSYTPSMDYLKMCF